MTRTTLELIPSTKTISFCGRHISTSKADQVDSITLVLQFIYLDVDLCISMTGGNKDSLQVYTKNEEWIESRHQNVRNHESMIE